MVDWKDILDSRHKQLKIVFSNTNFPLVSIIMTVQKNTLSSAIKNGLRKKCRVSILHSSSILELIIIDFLHGTRTEVGWGCVGWITGQQTKALIRHISFRLCSCSVTRGSCLNCEVILIVEFQHSSSLCLLEDRKFSLWSRDFRVRGNKVNITRQIVCIIVTPSLDLGRQWY